MLLHEDTEVFGVHNLVHGSMHLHKLRYKKVNKQTCPKGQSKETWQRSKTASQQIDTCRLAVAVASVRWNAEQICPGDCKAGAPSNRAE
eukprot:6280442-Amphidinium_carterae.1